MTQKDQVCHCPQFHKGKCTEITAKNYPKYSNGSDFTKDLRKALKKTKKKNK